MTVVLKSDAQQPGIWSRLGSLIARSYSILFVRARQIFVLSRSGYLPKILSQTHNDRETPAVAMIFGCARLHSLAEWYGRFGGPAIAPNSNAQNA